MTWVSNTCAGVAVAAAVYEIIAIVAGWTTITVLAWRLRMEGSPWLLLIAAVWLGLGWHLFVEIVKR